MGTLTANASRLPEYCEHKLPTSCRLSSIPGCCACADERAHAASYSTYIDGIGFVPRGNRWQRYCWFCKEFWQRRVDVSGLRPAQTRIPEVPDQTEFLERWYEFHRGYREVTKEDGSVEKVAVLGEPFRDVAPGDLPRTVEELRAGPARSEAAQRAHQLLQPQEVAENGPSLEDQLEDMFQEASAEENGPTALPRVTQSVAQDTTAQSNNIHAQAMQPAGSRSREYQARRIAALRRELHRMRNGIERVISGLRDLGESVPDSAGATSHLANLDRTLGEMTGVPSEEEAARAISSVNSLASQVNASAHDRTLSSMQARVDEARQHFNEARRSREQATRELELADQEYRTSERRLQQLQREHRTAENYTRVFGTREDMDRAGAEYESPIGGMFTRAWERFRVAEEVRREERTLRQVLEDEEAGGGEAETTRLRELEAATPDIWSVRRPRQQDDNATQLAEGNREEAALEEYYSILRRQDWNQSTAAPGDDSSNFPQSMLNSVVAQRETAAADRNALLHSMATAYRQSLDEEHSPTLQAQGLQSMSEAWRDAVNEEALNSQSQTLQDTARRFVADEPFRWPLGLPRSVEEAMIERLMRGVCNGEDRTRLVRLNVNSSLARSGEHDDEEERTRDVEFLMETYRNSSAFRDVVHASEDPELNLVSRELDHATSEDPEVNLIINSVDLVWAARLPADRARRWRAAGREFQIDGGNTAGPTTVLQQANIEAMAEAFQMSSRVRRQSGIPAPQQLQMLYRLQRGERTAEDREVLEEMLTDPDATVPANEVRAQAASRQDRGGQVNGFNPRDAVAFSGAERPVESSNVSGLEQMIQSMGTQQAANNLETNQTDSRQPRVSLFHRIRDDSTAHHYAADTDSELEESESDNESRGLDAKDTGRPEAKSDEEMTIRLECRICYTQMAEIACLPCGHLVMCRWCSDQHSPTLAHDRTRPTRAAGCPVCRKGIRQKVRVFRA